MPRNLIFEIDWTLTLCMDTLLVHEHLWSSDIHATTYTLALHPRPRFSQLNSCPFYRIIAMIADAISTVPLSVLRTFELVMTSIAHLTVFNSSFKQFLQIIHLHQIWYSRWPSFKRFFLSFVEILSELCWHKSWFLQRYKI